MNNWPQEIRKVDLPGLVGALQEIAGPVQVGQEIVSADGLEALLSFFERFVPLLEKSSQSIMNMRGFEARQSRPQDVVDPGADEDGWYENEVWVEDDSPAQAPARQPRPQPRETAEPPQASLTSADPQKVYAAILETMAQLPGEMTIETALQMARDQKPLILRNIAAELEKL